MHKTIVIAAGLAVALGTTGGVAASAAKLTDAQIANIAYTAGQLDIENAKQALDKSTNKEVQRFAQRMVADHGSVNAQARWSRSSTSLLRITRRARA